MAANAEVQTALRELGPVFRAKDAVAAGVSWRDLYQARDSGWLVEVSRGVYELREHGSIDRADFVAVSARAPKGMVCLMSALEYWDLTDVIPAWVDVAVPAGSHRPQIRYPPTRVHVFQAATFDLGRVRAGDEGEPGFWITNPERTVADCFRLRHQIGQELAVGALRRYLERRDSKPGQMLDFAAALRVRTPVLDALRVLQA
jgi:predicted transcriptional regulator of viral defense system